ncbi:hypothetical protein ACH0BA_06470, partial [Kocuria palustris]
RRILTVRGGYHGDTTGAMSVCDPEGGMHAEFSGLVAEQLFAATDIAVNTPSEVHDGHTASPRDR